MNGSFSMKNKTYLLDIDVDFDLDDDFGLQDAGLQDSPDRKDECFLFSDPALRKSVIKPGLKLPGRPQIIQHFLDTPLKKIYFLRS